MKKLMTVSGLILILSVGCASTGYYNTQKGAAIGAGIGALAGQAIGRDTEATLIGAGTGALLGSIIGNGMDQNAQMYRDEQTKKAYSSNYSGSYKRQSPPGRWVSVPGHWNRNVWVPSHEEWQPVNPGY
jgi:surface antigen